jgi:hypothetical protein
VSWNVRSGRILVIVSAEPKAHFPPMVVESASPTRRRLSKNAVLARTGRNGRVAGRKQNGGFRATKMLKRTFVLHSVVAALDPKPPFAPHRLVLRWGPYGEPSGRNTQTCRYHGRRCRRLLSPDGRGRGGDGAGGSRTSRRGSTPCGKPGRPLAGADRRCAPVVPKPSPTAPFPPNTPLPVPTQARSLSCKPAKATASARSAPRSRRTAILKSP